MTYPRIVLICSSLTAKDLIIFMYLLVICASSSEDWSFLFPSCLMDYLSFYFFNDWVYTFQMIINYQNKYFSFQDLFVCAHVCVCAHAMCIVCTLSCTGQEKWLDFLELGCQPVVSCLTWVVRSELRFSGEAEGALHSNCLCSPRIVNS